MNAIGKVFLTILKDHAAGTFYRSGKFFVKRKQCDPGIMAGTGKAGV